MRLLRKSPIITLLLMIAFSFLIRTTAKAEVIVPPPEFSVPAGLYTDIFNLTLSTDSAGSTIYYTTNGSEPDITNKTTYKYTAPIEIGYTAIRETPSNYFCGTVLRAVAVGKDGSISDVATASYFVNKDIFTKYQLPIISITTDNDNLFNVNTGIMSPNNTKKKGIEWERPIHFEYFDKDGKQQISIDAGIRLHGAASRDWVFKSFRVYARTEYDDDDQFDYDFFSGSVLPAVVNNGEDRGEDITKFKRLILRNGGNEGTARDGTFIRDALAQALMVDTTLDLQAYIPAVTFLNGEFYGIQNIQEREDEKYIEDHYNVDENDVVIYDFWYDEQGKQQIAVTNGEDTDAAFYLTINEFLNSKDLSVKENYEQIKKWFDIENYVDYQIINLYGANTDWPGNNCKAWRVRTEYDPNADFGLDGRLRWIVFDQDFSFGLYDQMRVYLDSITEATKVGGTKWPTQDGSTLMFRKLLENEEFKTYFCQRYLDLLNTNFDAAYANTLVDKMAAPYKSVIEEFRMRFHTIGDYEENIESVKNFIISRGDICKLKLNSHFTLGKQFNLTVKTLGSNNNALDGKITVNTITLDSSSKGVVDGVWIKSYFDGLTTSLTAVPDEGYEFVSWSGSSDSTEPTIDASKLSLSSGDVTITPIFKAVSEVKDDKADNTLPADIIEPSDKAANAAEVLATGPSGEQKPGLSKDSMMYLVSVILLIIIIVILIVYIVIQKKKRNHQKQ